MSEPRSDNLASGLATQLLVRVRDGDSDAARDLLPLVYEQLRAIAGSYFRRQGPNHTLQPTALVHEAFVKLVAAGDDWKSRAHFCAVASTAMRQILQNHARAKRAAKRAGQRAVLTVDRLATPGIPRPDLCGHDITPTKLRLRGPQATEDCQRHSSPTRCDSRNAPRRWAPSSSTRMVLCASNRPRSFPESTRCTRPRSRLIGPS